MLSRCCHHSPSQVAPILTNERPCEVKVTNQRRSLPRALVPAPRARQPLRELHQGLETPDHQGVSVQPDRHLVLGHVPDKQLPERVRVSSWNLEKALLSHNHIISHVTFTKSNLGTRHRPQPISWSLLKVSCFNTDGSMISNRKSGSGWGEFQFSYKMILKIIQSLSKSKLLTFIDTADTLL